MAEVGSPLILNMPTIWRGFIMNTMKKANKNIFHVFFIGCQFIFSSSWAQSSVLPEGLIHKIPSGYEVLFSEKGDLNKDSFVDYLIVLRRPNEVDIAQNDKDGNAPKRPVLIYVGSVNGDYHLAARNDSVVYAVNEGGQCDPFLDGENGITISGGYFTIENGVNCGQHWTDYITFKYNAPTGNWIFHKRVFENWVLNSSKKPNADALKLQVRKVTSGKDKPPVMFSQYMR
jgi:hypothetical protein